MKSLLLSIIFLTSMLSGLNAQDKLVNPLSTKLQLVELEEDFRAFHKKVSQLNIKKANKTALAEEYSQLIDRMDAHFHTVKKGKTMPNFSAMTRHAQKGH